MKLASFALPFTLVIVLTLLLGTSSAAQAAPAGTALQFNGSSQYVTFGAAAGLTQLGVQTFTIEAWFKRTGVGTTTTTGTGGLTALPLVTKGRGEGDNSNLDMNYFFGIDTSGVLAADFEECARAQTGCPATTTNLNGGGQNYPVRGATLIQDNVWYHGAVTFDGRYWKLYLNGVLETMTGADTGANRYPRWDSIQHAGLATAMTSAGTAGAAGYFAGVLDEVRIWNVVRNQSDIQATMYQEVTSGTGLVARWGMNENTGTTINSSVGSFPGTLTGPPTWVVGFPDNSPPAAPTGLVATSGSGSVALAWTANTETDLAGYNIYRSASTPVVTTGTPLNGGTVVTSTSFSDNTLCADTNSYYYAVIAVDTSANKSGPSNEVSASALPPPPGVCGLSFNGTNQYVTFGAAPGLGTATFTLETWFYWTGGAGTNTGSGGIGDVIPLISKGRAESDSSNLDMNYIFGIQASTGKLAADFEDTATGGNHPVIGNTVVTKNAWHHAAATYNGTTWKLYLDGNLDATLAANATPRYDSIQHAGLASAMTSTGASAGYFGGVLDEARVWDSARTAQQIRSTINQEVTSATGLIGRWGMNEGTGTAVGDSSGSGINGTATNGPLWVAGAPFDAVVDITAPATPTGLGAVAGVEHIDLSWTANSETDLAGYNVYRSTASPVTKGTPLNGGTLLSATTFADSSASTGMTYYYAVSAVDTSGNESALSSEASAASLPGAYALDFGSGTAYVAFGDPAKLDLAQFTVETWFKRTGTGTANTTGSGGIANAIPLVTHGAPESDGGNYDANWILVIDNDTGKLAADFEDMASGLNHPVYGTTAITSNVWHHAAATYDGTTWRLYLDGNLEATLAVGQTPRSDTIQHTGLGTMLDSTGAPHGHFQGVLDEVRVWSVARTRAQIVGDINNELTSGSGLVARWGLNEGSGTSVGDSVPTAANGTITSTGYAWVAGAPFNITFDTTAPAAPTNLMASPRPGAVQLEWTANTESDLAGYNVYRSTSSPVTKGTPVNSTRLSSPSFLDSGVSAGTMYYFAVTAVDTSGNESALSGEVSAIPLPPPPAEALDLGNGNAYVALGDNADTAQFTLETWLRRDGPGSAISTGSGGQTLVPLITNGTAEAETAAADINYFFGIRGSDGVLCADFEEAQTGTTPGLNHPICGATALQNGTWYHAAATYDGTTWRLYLNGNLDSQLAVGQPANAANTSQLAFGTSMTTANATSGFFDGALDEVRIWNYARTQAEVASTINTKLTTPQTGLIGRWGLDEASGSVANDTSGSDFDGTITGTGYSWVAGSPFNAEVNLPPEAPTLTAPGNGDLNVPTAITLTVNVADPENKPLDVTFYGRPLQAAAGPDFTIVVIPDTQYYAASYPSIYNAQMQWIADNKTSNNIIYVASLGDNVDTSSNLTQWTTADGAYDILDTAGVPYGLATGNHDGAPSGTSNFNANFGVSRFTGRPYYGGHYGSDNDNHYDLFEASGQKFIAVYIEYDDTMTSTDHAVLQWANGLLITYSDRRAIVISHNMLQGGTSTSFSTQGQTIYNALKGNSNLFLIMGGHLDVASRRTDVYNGNTVYTLRSDYQFVDSQQSGYMRILRFSPADDMIYVRTYSPTQNKDYDKSDAAQNNFSLPYTMDGVGFQMIETKASVASGTPASIAWWNLNTNTQYEWFAIASDGTHQTHSVTWNFTTAASPTAVTLSSFAAKWAGPAVQIDWTTASEINNLGFNVLRSESGQGTYTRLNDSLIPGCPGCPGGSPYTYTDKDVTPGQTYYYKLQAVDAQGRLKEFGPVAAQSGVPACTTAPGRPLPRQVPDGAVVTSRRVSLDWADSDCADRYELQIRRGSAGGALQERSMKLTASEYVTRTLLPGLTYVWRVRGCNANGCSPWTAYWKFVVSAGSTR